MNKRAGYLLAILLIGFVFFFIAKRIRKHDTPSINLSAVVLKDLNGNNVDLAGYAGKPLLINFWGTWCGPCREEFPYFEKAKKKYGSQVNFVMVSDEPLEKLIQFKTGNSYTFFYAQSQKAFQQLGITSVPVTCFYNAEGSLIANKTEPFTEASLDEFIAEMIKEK